MVASLLRRQLKPLISLCLRMLFCLGLLLALLLALPLVLLAASTLHHELYTPSSNLHLFAERMLGRATSHWVGTYLHLRAACDPTHGHGHGSLPPEACSAQLDVAAFLSVVLMRLTSLYCWHVSPSPYTCFAHIGFRETVRFAFAGYHEVLERVILVAAKPFLYVFVLGRYL